MLIKEQCVMFEGKQTNKHEAIMEGGENGLDKPSELLKEPTLHSYMFIANKESCISDVRDVHTAHSLN